MLRRRLHAAGRPEETVVLEQAPPLPQSFEELWERLDETEFPHLLLTADPAEALALDESLHAPAWAARAWSGLRFLDDYARAQDFDGNVEAFCKFGAASVLWSPKHLAITETKATMDRWGSERVFPVPAYVHTAKKIQMKAHLKIGNEGKTAPRVHFHDATRVAGHPPKIIIGYIGKHLTNTKTNQL